jgi:hypothetical protein
VLQSLSLLLDCADVIFHWKINILETWCFNTCTNLLLLLFFARYIRLGTTEKKPKVGVSRNKCSHKQALCILKCLPFIKEKFPHVTRSSTALQMLAPFFMVLIHAHFFNGIMCKQNHLKKKNNPLVFFFPCTFWSTFYRAQTRSFLAHIM